MHTCSFRSGMDFWNRQEIMKVRLVPEQDALGRWGVEVIQPCPLPALLRGLQGGGLGSLRGGYRLFPECGLRVCVHMHVCSCVVCVTVCVVCVCVLMCMCACQVPVPSCAHMFSAVKERDAHRPCSLRPRAEEFFISTAFHGD